MRIAGVRSADALANKNIVRKIGWPECYRFCYSTPNGEQAYSRVRTD